MPFYVAFKGKLYYNNYKKGQAMNVRIKVICSVDCLISVIYKAL